MTLRKAIAALVALIIVGVVLHWGNSEPSSSASATSKQMLPSEIRAKLVGTFTCVSSFMAARTPEDGERLKNLIKENDTAAIRKMVLQGRVVLIQKGAAVRVDDWDAWRNIETIQVRGEPDTLYATVDAGR
jgi:hypothetical protein